MFSGREFSSFFFPSASEEDKAGAMYPLSKNKASFRIADILHQQQQQQQQTDSQLLAHHLLLKNNVHPSEMKTANLKANSNESKNSSPSPDISSTPEMCGDQITKGDAPMKPTPMYSNFPLPFPLGMHPAFHPAAAYLNYADAIHKGETENSALDINNIFELSTSISIDSCDQLITFHTSETCRMMNRNF